MILVLLYYSSKNPEEAELEDTLNQVVSRHCALCTHWAVLHLILLIYAIIANISL